MKKNFRTVVMAASAMLLTSGAARLAHAQGVERGNGGDAALCTRASGETIELLDLYEARRNGWTIDEAQYEGDEWQTAYEMAALLGPFSSANSMSKIADAAEWVRKNFREVEALPEILDAGGSNLEPECRVSQLAVQYKDDGGQDRVDVRQSYWARLGKLERAGLLLHEMFYRIARADRGDTRLSDSRGIRHLVGLAAADRVRKLTEEDRLQVLSAAKWPSARFQGYLVAPDSVSLDGSGKMAFAQLVQDQIRVGVNTIALRPGPKSKGVETHFYPSGNIRRVVLGERTFLSVGGRRLLSVSGEPIHFYETGEIEQLALVPLDTEFQTVSGAQLFFSPHSFAHVSSTSAYVPSKYDIPAEYAPTIRLSKGGEIYAFKTGNFSQKEYPIETPLGAFKAWGLTYGESGKLSQLGFLGEQKFKIGTHSFWLSGNIRKGAFALYSASSAVTQLATPKGGVLFDEQGWIREAELSRSARIPGVNGVLKSYHGGTRLEFNARGEVVRIVK